MPGSRDTEVNSTDNGSSPRGTYSYEVGEDSKNIFIEQIHICIIIKSDVSQRTKPNGMKKKTGDFISVESQVLSVWT